LRAAASSGERATKEAPQDSQNCASGLLSDPHAGQRGASALPQPPQNRALASCALPQLAQFMVMLESTRRILAEAPRVWPQLPGRR